MYKILYQGVDTLDVAFKGALPQNVIDELEAAKLEAEKMYNDKQGYGVSLGPDKLKFFVKATGKRGGFKYVFVDDPTGAIFAVKADTNPSNWNFFVSARALGLLCKTYEGMKMHMEKTLRSLGAQIKAAHVNRIDYAIDIATTNFELDMRNFVASSSTQIQPYYSREHDLDEHVDKTPSSEEHLLGTIMRGGRFESVTVGKMPNRQVIVYDKLKAAKDLRTLYWFDVWGVDPNDAGTQVWRVEIRGGKKALVKITPKGQSRSYQTIEAALPKFLSDTLKNIRYVTNKDAVSNISRSTVHPLWLVAQDAVKTLPKPSEPALPQAYVLEQMRKERVAMAIAQGFGNLNNLFVLEGHEPDKIVKHYPEMLAKEAHSYREALGSGLHLDKLATAKEKLGVFVGLALPE